MRQLMTAIIALPLLGFLAMPQPARAGLDPFIGEIMTVGYTFCPRGWAEADGQLLDIASNTALFSLYGTTYGGDGRTTFALPDLRGRVPIHTGQGPGLTNRPPGSKGGEENHSLTVGEMPTHNHALNASEAEAREKSPSGNLLARRKRRRYIGPGAGSDVQMHSSAIGQTGANQGHNTMQPFLTIRFCVALEGVFPSPN